MLILLRQCSIMLHLKVAFIVFSRYFQLFCHKKSQTNKYVWWFLGQHRIEFFTGVLWSNILARSLKLEYINDSLHKTLIDGLESCGLLVDYCDVLSAVWTLILTAPIHCRGSICEHLWSIFSKSVLMKKQTHLHLEWSGGEYIFSKFSFFFKLFFYLNRKDTYLKSNFLNDKFQEQHVNLKNVIQLHVACWMLHQCICRTCDNHFAMTF